MIRVILDPELMKRLHELAEPLELCDESGRVLAHVAPVPDWSQLEPLTADVSEEELDRRSQSAEKRYSTAEMLRYLDGH